MRNVVTVLLIASVGVLGLFLYLQTSALQVQELTAQLESMSKTSNLDLEEKCAKQARAEFNELGWKNYETAVFSNHYNKRLNKCFVRIENTDAKTAPGTVWTHKTVSDAFEGRGLCRVFLAHC